MSELARQSITFNWHDPSISQQAREKLSGLEFLQKVLAGELPSPPMISLMNARLVEVSEGRAVYLAEPAEYHFNLKGGVHGGYAATVLDSVMGCAVTSMLPAGVGWTTLELKLNYVRPINAARRLRCESAIIHLGNRVATAEGKILDEAGKLYAHATTTCLVLR